MKGKSKNLFSAGKVSSLGEKPTKEKGGPLLKGGTSGVKVEKSLATTASQGPKSRNRNGIWEPLP